MGAIPVVVADHEGMDALFNDSPVLKLSNWEKGCTQEDLLGYTPPKISRKVLMFQYWNDKIDCLKKSL